MRRITTACCASFWPKNATRGSTTLRSFATIVATPVKCSAPRPGRVTVEHVGETAPDLDRGREAGRVDLTRLRRVDEVDARLRGDPQIGSSVARVGGEVLAGAELGGVHEQAHDDDLAALPGRGE